MFAGQTQRLADRLCKFRKALEPEIILADAGEARDLVTEEVEGFVFLDWAADSGAALNARVGLLYGNRFEPSLRVGDNFDGKRIARLQGTVAQESEKVTVNLIRAGLRHDVDHASHRASVFRHIVAGDYLKFLHGFLRDGSANAVDGVVDSVRPVYRNFV